MSSADLIIPDVYDPDLSAINWLQEHLPFPNDYLAQLIGIRPELGHYKCAGMNLDHTLNRSTLRVLLCARYKTAKFAASLMQNCLECEAERRGHSEGR